ncbi:substrate-binding domain-containing protein [Terasakiella sp. A23]|uniref:substrate-binding domain-containing protein n=1 Tax=Terasakiella sp. FCG-A23 TaxID=3080561 RepID=UPI0029559F09|nr:substrate-binding domain-containing protein [Terasakiella sp. A23]MDV7340562.1 substrate-binding domain-containing protein [Terasakiella sp. A23]
MKRLSVFLSTVCVVIMAATFAHASSTFITVASTTSTANSGLFEFLLPKFTEETGIEVRVVAVGTGQAIRLARKGDADVLFVHHRPSEEKFVADGFGKKRFDVMYNDFVIVGPKEDPAKIKGCSSPVKALSMIKDAGQSFASRGDDSGTNKRELSLWKAAGLAKEGLSGKWYRATGSGMGATLNIAAGMNAYSLSDRGTWIAFKNKQSLEVLCEGDKALFNPYGVIAVSKDKFPHIKEMEATKFVKWLVSLKGQKLIGDFRVQNERLFTPNAQ